MKEETNSKRRALGMGLEQLFNSEMLDFDQVEEKIVEETPKDEIVEIPINELMSNPYQPRKVFDEEALKELSESIKEHGVFQPIIVKKSVKGYNIIAGERRTKASELAGLKTVPAIVRDFSDEEMMQVALLENLQREELNPIEEALAYRSLIKNYEVTQEEISEAVGKSRPHITNTLRLLNLPQKIMDMIDQGQITAGHGKALLRVNDENLQLELANKVIAEELSVRATEALAKKICEDNIKEVPKKSKEKDVFIVDVEEKLRNIFGTKVNISKGKKKGKIEIEYYNEDDLNNIVSMLLEDN